ncbi:hypothetical protein HK101_002894 [Irineochytrium annulatum]|nr:hypothetical protein HK101_002894 [Irineochytrium annulatum]
MGSPFGIRRLVHMQNLLIAIHNGYSKLLPNARQAPSNPEQQVVPEIPVPPLRIDSLTAGDTDDAMAAKPLPPIVDDGTTRQWSPERKFFKETPRLAMDFFTKDEVPLESMFEDAMASTRFAVHYNQTIATSRDNILPDPSTTADQQDTRSESETSLSMPSKSSSEDVVVNAGRSTLSPIEESATFEVLGDLREQETTISDTQTSSEGPSDVATVETTPPLPPPRSVFHVPPPPRKAPPRTLSRDLHPPAITTTRSHTSPSYKSPSSSKSPPLSACKALPAVPPSPLSPERGGASTGARETGGRDSRSLRRSMSDPTIHVTYASQAPPMPGFAVGESAATYAARGPAVRRPMAFFGNAVRRARTSWTPLPSGSPLPASRGGSSDEDGTARTGNAGVGVTPSLRWKRSKVNIMAVAVLGSIFNKAGGRREDREEEEMPVAVATSKGEMQVRRSASFENGGADGRASWRLMSSNSSVGGDGGRRRRASLDAAVGSWLNGVLGPVDGQSEREEEKVYEAPVVRKPMRLDGPFEWETKGFMGLESDLVVGESSYDAIVSPKSVPEPAKPNPVAKVAPDSPPAVPPKSHKPAKSPMPFPPPSPPKSTSERPLSPTRIPRAPESVAAAAAEPAAPARPIAPTSPTRRGRKNQTETVFQGAELEEMRGLMKGLSKLEGPVVKQQQQQQPQQQRQANGRRSQRSGTGQQAPSGVRDKPAAGSLFTPFSLATREELVTGRTLMEEIFEQEFGGAAAVVGGRASVKGKEESLGAFAAVRECDAEVGSSLRTPRGGALEVGVELEHERMKSGMLDSVFRLDWSLPM